MSLSSDSPGRNPAIIDFYTKHLGDFGNSAKGVGWKNDEAQLERFAQLVKVIGVPEHFSINDLGCGTGRLVDYLTQHAYRSFTYHGYDILDDMVQTARTNFKDNSSVSLAKIESPENMREADYTVASGIFNVKYEVADDTWLKHVLHTLEVMNAKSVKGLAFNVLTKYSDAQFMQGYLYYADPLLLFDYCKKNFAKNVALLHDYHQYDFTIIVRKA